MDQIKKFLADHSITSHTVAAFVATLVLFYNANTQFHDLVLGYYGRLPAVLKTFIEIGIAFYGWYKVNKKTDSTSSGSGGTGGGSVLNLDASPKTPNGPASSSLNRRVILALSLNVVTFFLLPACAVKSIHPDGTPTTSFENALLVNASLANVNNSVAKGVIQLQSIAVDTATANGGLTKLPVTGSLSMPRAAAAKILRVQALIAADDNKLTVILDSGPQIATTRAAEIQAAINRITSQVALAVQDGTLGVKNPASKNTFTADLQKVSDLATQLTGALKLAGVLK